MSTRIKMGNDEFILYIRKNYQDCTTSNVQLAKSIWGWIEKNAAPAEQLYGGKSVPCYWGVSAANIDDTKLPKTATQFEFEREKLPKLYDYLDSLGTGQDQAQGVPMEAVAQ